MPAITVESPIGPLTVTETDSAITEISWARCALADSTPLLARARVQIEEYFSGRRRRFDLPLAPRGTPHQQAVWRHMLGIPSGRTETYGDIARAIGSAPRAVGVACGQNPIPIVIPCHRVIGKNGKLTGYSGRGGTRTKRFLLQLEAGQPGLFPHD